MGALNTRQPGPETRCISGTTHVPVGADQREEWLVTELHCVTIVDKYGISFARAFYTRSASLKLIRSLSISQ